MGDQAILPHLNPELKTFIGSFWDDRSCRRSPIASASPTSRVLQPEVGCERYMEQAVMLMAEWAGATAPLSTVLY